MHYLGLIVTNWSLDDHLVSLSPRLLVDSLFLAGCSCCAHCARALRESDGHAGRAANAQFVEKQEYAP